MRAFILAVLFILLGITLACAEVEIRAEVDKRTISTDELLTYKVMVTSSEQGLPDPGLPDFRGFAVVSQARSSTISLAKGAAKKALVFVYVLAPVQTGKVEIAPATVTEKGKTYQSDSFEIEITQGKREIRPQAKPPPGPPSNPLPDTSATPKVTL